MTETAGRCAAKEFVHFQEERVRTHSKLAQAHKAYLASGAEEASGESEYDLDSYKAVVGESTKAFSRISKAIIELRKDVKDEKLSGWIDRVQTLEEAKLRMTVDLQLAAQHAQEEASDELAQKNAAGIRTRMRELEEEISEVLEEVRYYVAEEVDR